MKKKSKGIIIILVVAIFIIIVLLALAIDGKKKLDFVLDVGRNMYEFNEKVGKSENVYSKYTYNSNYFEDYVFGKNSKSVQFENGVKTTRVNTQNKVVEYKEINGKKLMCILPAEDDQTDDYYEEEDSVYNQQSYKPSIMDRLFSIFNTIPYGLKTKIIDDVIEGRECYVITTSEGKTKNTQYVDKSNKVVFRTKTTEISSNGREIVENTSYEYSFGTVTSDDVKELDESEYTIISKEEFDNPSFL